MVIALMHAQTRRTPGGAVHSQQQSKGRRVRCELNGIQRTVDNSRLSGRSQWHTAEAVVPSPQRPRRTPWYRPGGSGSRVRW